MKLRPVRRWGIGGRGYPSSGGWRGAVGALVMLCRRASTGESVQGCVERSTLYSRFFTTHWGQLKPFCWSPELPNHEPDIWKNVRNVKAALFS